MPTSVHRRADCRLCGGESLELVLALTPTPPANAFVPKSELGVKQSCFPLDVHQCADCGHVQLLDIVDPGAMFADYVYVSGTSPVFVDHFRRYAESVIADFGLRTGDFVVDIGSNDGTLLGFFKSAGMRVLGVDPAKTIAQRARDAGIETRTAFFTPELARDIRAEYGAAALVTANNVFAHADDLGAVVEGAKILLAADGRFVFEVSYFVDVFEKTLFDTIYHEHLSYHTVAPLVAFFDDLGMTIVDVERIDTHGGSIRVVVENTAGEAKVQPSVARLVALEERLKLGDPDTLRRFADGIAGIKATLVDLLRKLAADGAKIAGYGAPAKATTLIHHFGLEPDLISFIVDDSPLKQGLYTPGNHIPVLPSSALLEQKIDYVVVLAWNFADSIIRNNEAFGIAGGRFIVPLPEVKII